MSKKKSKGDKPETLSKKERKALEAREAELAAELAKREKKARKKKPLDTAYNRGDIAALEAIGDAVDARKKADKKAEERDLKSAKKAVAASEKSNAKAAKRAKKGKSSVPAPVFDDVTEVVDESDVVTTRFSVGTQRRIDMGLITEEEAGTLSMSELAALADSRAAEVKIAEPLIPIIDHSPDEIRVAAHKVLDDPNSTEGARDMARRALETADVKERVRARAAERTERAKTPGAEAEYQMGELKKKKGKTPTLAARELDDVESSSAIASIVDADISAHIVKTDQGEAIQFPRAKHVAEVVETEEGRIFETGAAPEPAAEGDRPHFVKPSDAPAELEEGRNGYKIIMLGTDGKPDPRKVRQMTRMTTYVNNIDDETTLKKWDKRMVVEGLAADALAPEPLGLIPQINDLVHRRDVKITKAIKADRKGKLGIGELGHVMKAAEKEARDALDDIVEQAAHLAGRNDKANLGTHLHTLAEIRDEHGIDRVRELQESGELVAHDNDGKDGLEPMPVTATDLATIEAYDQRMTRLGAKVIHSEAVIVDDEALRAGRLDRVIMARLPELVLGKGTPSEWKRPADQRAKRYIMDLKSGNVELGAGKIARQLAGYALGKLYDLETGERTAHGAVRDVALVFHIPQGEGVCHVYAVDLKAGAALLKLSGEVRRARNTGKKTIDVSVDIADPATD